MSHAASAIQKTVSEIVANHCQPVSTAIAYVADEYIPSGNTVGQPSTRAPPHRHIHQQRNPQRGHHPRHDRHRAHTVGDRSGQQRMVKVVPGERGDRRSAHQNPHIGLDQLRR